MRNTYFILSALIVSVFVLTSVGKPTEVSILKPKSENSIVSDTLSWKLLGQIKYVKKPSKDYPEGVMFPVVNTSLKAKNKKSIIMSGFI
ncbi:MAG: hypothetical protein EOO45_11115, partial [Flavobacterium sp.]